MTRSRLTLCVCLLAALAAFFSLGLAQRVQNAASTLLAPSVGSLADARVASVQIQVAPERPSWTYRVGEPVRFKVTVTADKHPLGGLPLTYRVGPEMLPAKEQQAVLPSDGTPLLIDGGTLNEPGFIRCDISMEFGGRSYSGRGTAGLSPDEIRPTQVDPADFDAFWAAALAELADTPMEPLITHLPERSNSKVDVYHVGIRTGSNRYDFSRVYGVLCVPKGEGPFPAVLQVPGAGVHPYNGDRDLAERGVITLQIGIHGLPVNLDPAVYYQLSVAGLHLDDPERYYYRRVYLACVRANDFLVSHPKFDGKNLLVMGGSQGGQLAIVTAALDPRVIALSSMYPAYCDVTGYLHGRAGGWPHMMRAGDGGTPSPHATGPKLRTTSYYDVVNFARRLKVPGHYYWGYNDTSCPPTSLYAAYNVITAPKQLLLALEMGHSANAEANSAINDWILGKIGVR